MKDKATTYRPPLVLKVLDFEPDLKTSETVTWLKEVFPRHFEISLMLEDQTPNSLFTWVATFEFIFQEGEPFFKSVKCTGLGYGNAFDPRMSKTPLETGNRTEVEQLQRWQLNYVQENLLQLKRACFELVARNVTFNENGTVSSGGASWSNDYPKGRGLEEFSKDFDEWQARTLLTPSLLRDVAEMYREEVLEAEKARRKATPAKVISQQYGKPVATVNRWIAKAREEGFLPQAEKGKATSKFPLNNQEGDNV